MKDIDQVQFEYSIKIMNPGRMSEFKNVRVCKWKNCKILNDLRALLSAKVSSIEVSGEKPDFEVVDLGYIEPGHGMKGRKQWLNTDSDVGMMYEQHAGKRSILLWAYSHVQHCRAKNPSKRGESGSNFQEHKKSLSEVDEKYDELRKKHGNKYTLEQLRMRAHLIHLGKHESTDEPPDKPYWRGRRRQQPTVTTSELPPAKRIAPSNTGTGVSPTKKVSVRSELLDQLAKWHKLNETGVVTDGEYEDLKKTILSDIKQL